MTTTTKRPRGWIAGVAALIATLAMLTVAQAAMAMEFEGPVLSKNRDAKTFRMNPENHGNVTVKVTSQTKFQRIDGYGGLHRGLDVEVIASKSGDGPWVASKIEKPTGGGHGADDR